MTIYCDMENWAPFVATKDMVKGWLGIPEEIDFDLKDVKVCMAVESDDARMDYADDKVVIRVPRNGMFLKIVLRDKLYISYSEYEATGPDAGEFTMRTYDVSKMSSEEAAIFKTVVVRDSVEWIVGAEKLIHIWNAINDMYSEKNFS